MQNIPRCLFALFLANLCLHPASAYEIYKVCNISSNFTIDSAYGFNLKNLISSLVAKAVSRQGFSESTIGAAPDQISGLVLCRGDVDSSTCNQCLDQSFRCVTNKCPYSKEASIYDDYCLIHYSDWKFFNKTDNLDSFMKQEFHPGNITASRFNGWDSSNSTVKKHIKNVIKTLLTRVADQAAYHSRKRFGTGMINISASLPVIYGLSQCTPVFSKHTCRACLQDLIDQMLERFGGLQNGLIFGIRCNLRYDTNMFFLRNPDVQISPISGTPTNTSKGEKNRLIIIISASMALLVFGCFIIILWIRKLRKAETETSQEERMLKTTDETLNLWSGERSSDFPHFEFKQIAYATGNFSLGNKLGEGGFGPVYKGVLRNGLEIAVKRLSTHSGQGLIEFKNETHLIANLQHRNLVRLVGWCIWKEEKILIYEFMPNKSLDCFIFDKTREAQLNWDRRFEIIEGIAQGLLYLHKHSRLRIVHRDLKASNILLDSEMNPKISDFGLARIFSPEKLQANTKRVVGTYGYMAPEYASEGLYSIKSDVFSFGVLLLEIVSSKRNHRHGDFLNLLGYAWDRWRKGNISELISPTLTEAPERQIERCIHVGLLCVQENPADRPIMSDVIMFLTDTRNMILPEPKQPANFNVRVTEKGVQLSGFNGSSCSINDVILSNPDGDSLPCN